MSLLPNQTARGGLVARLADSATFAIVVSALTGIIGTTVVSVAAAHDRPSAAPRWTEAQRTLLRSLSLTSLAPVPPDPSNRYADDARAAALGRELFFDTRLSGNGKVSCATCHVPAQDLQDGTPLAHGVGTTARRTMPIAGTAHDAWFFWDGRADSQWAQALGPLESAAEHGGTRAQYAQIVADHYRSKYETIFGALPQDDISRVYANIGKAIAAFERRIEFSPSRFDRFVDAELAGKPQDASSTFSPDEEAGLRLFIGKANCSNCHNGALLSDDHFHNTGVPVSKVALPVDSGRSVGVRQALAGEFNCTSRYSDAKPDDCEELRFAVTDGKELVRAYKTPSLRNVANRSPYMHAGQLTSLSDVLAHYNSAPAAPFGQSELKPLHLSTTEQQQLVAFLKTLTSPLAAPKGWLERPSTQPK